MGTQKSHPSPSLCLSVSLSVCLFVSLSVSLLLFKTLAFAVAELEAMEDCSSEKYTSTKFKCLQTTRDCFRIPVCFTAHQGTFENGFSL